MLRLTLDTLLSNLKSVCWS